MIADAHGRLIAVRGPIEGCAHDARALRETGLPALLAGAAYVFADLGYRGTGYFTPRRKPVGGQLTDQQREYNERISAIRAPIERAVTPPERAISDSSTFSPAGLDQDRWSAEAVGA